jgi:hypothetical protein
MPLRVLGLIVAFVLLSATVAAAQPTTPAHSFVTHAAFFSVESKQANLLGFTLAQWFGARGRAVLSPLPGGGTMMVYSMTGLVPGGVYSFFENHFSSDGVTFTPLDGSADHNTFTATSSGAANGSISIPAAVTHSEGILLVYHSDGVAHGADRGQIGVNAHHQLIIRLQ